jgi:enoyl-[acyl-carrier protein] reductase I
MAGLVEGKKILIMGLRNKWSIAWGVAKKLHDEGARLAFTYQGERERDGMASLAMSLADGSGGSGESAPSGNGAAGSAQGGGGGSGESTPGDAVSHSGNGESTPGGGSAAGSAQGGGGGSGKSAPGDAVSHSGNGESTPGGGGTRKGGRSDDLLIMECDAGRDADIDAVFSELSRRWGTLDGVVHAVAHARSDDIRNDFLLTSRDGFAHALDISAYSLVYVSRRASELMPEGGSIVTLTYMGSQRVFPNYNVMGVAKAALEASVRYLAHSLGQKGIRVNAVSSGPIKTISSKAVKDFSGILGAVEEKAPLRRNVLADEVGGAALYLLSGLSSAVTGEVHYVDCGYSIMG